MDSRVAIPLENDKQSSSVELPQVHYTPTLPAENVVLTFLTENPPIPQNFHYTPPITAPTESVSKFESIELTHSNTDEKKNSNNKSNKSTPKKMLDSAASFFSNCFPKRSSNVNSSKSLSGNSEVRRP